MSEFSNSLHLVSDEQQDGIDLLRRAETPGWVFPASQGWVTMVVDDDMLVPAPPAVVLANSGLLLDYLNAEDHGWMFRLFRGPTLVHAYECAWEDDVEVNTAGLVLDELVDVLGTATGRRLDPENVRRLLFVETFDQVLADFPGGNPGHKFAEAIGLEYFEWLSGHYMNLPDAPAAPGAVYVE